MLSSSDVTVQSLLELLSCSHDGATDGLSRRKLLARAFAKVQLGHTQAMNADGLVHPSALPELPPDTKQLLTHWDTDKVFSVKVRARSTSAVACM
jgi:hypothetical protein